MKRIKKYFKRLFNIMMEPEIKILPGQIAFFLFLSLVPIITLIIYSGLILSIGTDSVAEFVSKIFPNDISSLLIPYVNNAGIDFGTILFMITGFLIASNGPHSLIIASNTLYKFKHSAYLKRRIKALFMTILLVLLFIFTILVLAFGNSIMNFIVNISFLQNISDKLYLIYIILKWPFALFIVFFIIKILYTWAPDQRIPSKYMNRGAVFTTIMWSIVTVIYSFYVNNFSSYNIFYGGLSNIAAIMMWVYALSLIFVIGIAINTEYYNMNKENEIE